MKRFEHGRRRLSREEKIDITGLMLKQQVEAGRALDSRNLLIGDEKLKELASGLGLGE
jgi:hypothetical protein